MTTELFTITYETTTDGVTDFENISTESQYTSVPTTIPLTFNVTTSPPKDNSNLGLTVGLSVGVPCGVAVIIAVIVAIIYLRKNKRKHLAKREDINPANTYANVFTTLSSTPTDPLYENVATTRRASDIYENPSASEDLYATKLPNT